MGDDPPSERRDCRRKNDLGDDPPSERCDRRRENSLGDPGQVVQDLESHVKNDIYL